MKRIPPRKQQARCYIGPAARAYDKAKEAAIERQLSSYIELTCGHLTTWEADEIYAVFRPDNRSHFCESCGRWQHRQPVERAQIIGDVMF